MLRNAEQSLALAETKKRFKKLDDLPKTKPKLKRNKLKQYLVYKNTMWCWHDSCVDVPVAQEHALTPKVIDKTGFLQTSNSKAQRHQHCIEPSQIS